MHAGERSTSLVLVAVTLILSAVVGLAVPLISGSQPGRNTVGWTPPAATATSAETIAGTPSPAAPALASNTPVLEAVLPSPSPTSAPSSTRTLPTLTATDTSEPAPVLTRAPTATRGLSRTPLVTVQPVQSEPSLTSLPAGQAQAQPTGGTPMVQVSIDLLNLRSSPNADSQVLGVARNGDRFAAVARNTNDTWLQVCCLNNAPVWLASGYVTVTGSIDALPVVP
jgi:uncharacterized protein YgiM (DUF1202 family)